MEENQQQNQQGQERERSSAENWPDVWALYWTPIPAEDIDRWDKEFSRTVPDIREEEVCAAIRKVRQSGGYEKFRPKIGVILDEIRSKRNKQEEESQAKPTHGRCAYCRSTGWMILPYVEYRGDDGRKRKRFPKGKWKEELVDGFRIYEHEMYMTVAIPCMCSAGTKFMVGDVGWLSEQQRLLRQWFLKLPDASTLKPDGLISDRTLYVPSKQEPAREVFKQQDNKHGEQWL